VPVRRYLVPFAAGVAVGIAVHKYWPQIKQAGGPALEKGLSRGGRLLDRARASLWEQSEKFSDLVAEIREEEEAAAKGSAPPAPDATV
jgi:hypothetical protein